MIILTVEALKDYCHCPNLYEKKYVSQKKPERNKSSSHYDGHSHVVNEAQDAIKELTGFYFHRLMDDRQVRYETLYNRWENKWWGKYSGRDIMEYVQPVSRANRVRINTNFINHLPKFHKQFHKPFSPIAVDKEVLFPHESIVLTSNIEMAYRTDENIVRIVKFLASRISPGKPERDIDLIAQACGWMLHEGDDKVEVAYYCMLSPDEYEAFTVGTVERRHMNSLARIIKAFVAQELAPSDDCAGCEYTCEVQ